MPDGMPDYIGLDPVSPTITAVAENVTVEDDGRPYLAAFDPENPRFWSRASVFVAGGGPEDFVYTPPILGDEAPQGLVEDANERQVVLVQRDLKAPGAVACVPHPQMKVEEEADQPGNNSDHNAKVSKQSFAVRRAGITVMIDENGAVVIDAKNSETPIVRVQLPDNGKLRVSRDGSAGGHPVLWHKLQEWLGDDEPAGLVEAVSLVKWAQNVLGRIAALEANVVLITELLGKPVVNGAPVGTSAELELIQDWSERTGEPDLGYPPVPEMGGLAIDMSKDVG